jgi:hypothetical protein
VLPEGGNAVLSSLAGLDGVTDNNRIAGYPLSVIPERRFNPGSGSGLSELRAAEGRQGAKGEDGPPVKTRLPPSEGGSPPPRWGRASARHRAELQRLAEHDFEG